MELFESLLIILIIAIIYILYITIKHEKYENSNKYSNNNSINNYDEIDKVSYRNSHSVYRNDYIYSNKINHEYKKYRYNIDNYVLKKRLLKNNEMSFYNIIKSSINENYIICPKIKISNFIGMLDQRSWEDYYDKINYQSLDFLICNETFKPLFGIILFYGNINIQTENEKLLDQIYQTINLPILRFNLNEKYSDEIIINKINNILDNYNI